MTAPLSDLEQQYYDRLFETVNKDDSGVLPGSDALPFLTSSGLPQQTLGEIWATADPDNNGFLTKDGFYKVARLIGWVQSTGQTQIDPSLATKAGPLPTFKGYPGPPAPASASPMSPTATGGSLPPLTPADRTKFTRIFVGCGPANGLVTGEKARNVFLKSKLPYDKLAQIWQLADTQDRGALDLTDFIIGMHLIQSCMANPTLRLPASLPPSLYEVASNGRPPPNVAHGIRPTSPIQAQSTGPLQRQATGTLQPQVTGQSFSAATNTPPRSATMTPSRQASTAIPYNAYGGAGGHNRASSGAAEPWDVTPDAKATSDRFFAQLDPQNRGVVEGDVAVPFMLQSQLDEGTLASIWDLADIRQEGKLDRDEFAVAMHLINAKLAGQDIPMVLPNTLIPPNLRGSHADRPEVTQPSSASKDLFDLFNDANEVTPSAPASGVSATTAFLPQPPSRRGTGASASRQLPAARAAQTPEPFSSPFAPAPQPAGDLLGDDSAASVPEKSADIGNKRLQLENTTRGLSQLEKTKSELGQQESTNAADLQTLERELASARSKHETETKAVSDLRIRVGEQTAKLKQLRADVISAESDLNAMRMEKDELEQSFLRDKEEVRGLQKQIKELEDEKTGLKLLLEKVRKEARQQKGLVSIAKKQVSTAEGGRDAVQAEVREVEQAIKDQESSHAAVASASPLHTPRALSPNATGASHRSTNPFERFRTPSAELSPAVAAAGASGALAGAALSGLAGGANTARRSSTNLSPPGANEPGQPHEQDPFGMPPAGSAVPPAAGFDDSFGQQVSPITTDHAPTDFDSAFADFDTETSPAAPSVEGATPTATEQMAPSALSGATMDRPEHDRSLSTQAIPPSSHRSTPVPAEQPSGVQASPIGHSENQVVESTDPGKELTSGDAESSDEDEGPEDVEGPRRTYGIEHRSPSLEAAVRSEPVNADAELPAARVRRHAPPPPTGRQSSRSESLASPVIDEQHAGMSAMPVAPGAVDPFGAPVEAPSGSSLEPQLPTDAGKDDFGEAFDPLSTVGAPAIHSSGTPDVPGAFPAPVDVSHGAPKASEFDDDDEFDFSDMPPTADQAALASAKDTPEPQDLETSPFGQPTMGQPQPQSQPHEEHQHSQDVAQLQPGVPQQQQQQQQQQHQQQQQQQQPATNAFDDEFANFDDDFGDFPSQPNSGSDNNNSMLRSYEVVGSDHVKQPGEGGLDAWGISNSHHTAAGWPVALSFDDAFGGDFSPAPSPGPVSGAPPAEPASVATPPIPARPKPPPAQPSNDVPQADDLEDVKRLCSMGFPRSLVVEALDANGYDFQKALNVLLVK